MAAPTEMLVKSSSDRSLSAGSCAGRRCRSRVRRAVGCRRQSERRVKEILSKRVLPTQPTHHRKHRQNDQGNQHDPRALVDAAVALMAAVRGRPPR